MVEDNPKMSSYGKIRKALKELCSTSPSPGEILFRINFSVASVAEKSGCSMTTTRKYLNELSRCRGYSRVKINGTYGYRYDGEF